MKRFYLTIKIDNIDFYCCCYNDERITINMLYKEEIIENKMLSYTTNIKAATHQLNNQLASSKKALEKFERYLNLM